SNRLICLASRHILSISGSHMGMIAMIAYGVFFFIFRGALILLPRMNAHYAAMVMVVLSVAAYSVISGGQIPTLRAFFMAMMSMMSILLNRHSNLFLSDFFWWHSSLSLLIIIYSIRRVFYLSFLCGFF
ncbi:MAG: ComEC/Rec2 family competence protein, partial [Gammaproteobacteria bacterium]|nr:ComEC/Rec2 family competence protein [Gammaproteobacteria bacterium]